VWIVTTAGTLRAQTARPATVVGTVIDSALGEPLIGATVVLVNTQLGTQTDYEGRYRLANIPPGTYTLEIRYVGYATVRIENLQLAAGQELAVDYALPPVGTHVEAVQITATVNKANVNTVLTMQRNMTVVADGLAQDAIRRTPDKDIGQVIRRVSGVSIQDGRFAVVRGLNERYNQAMVNNLLLPSTEPDRKAFSFDIFPAALLDNLFVIKTAQPDLPGEFAGGLIQLNTREVPDSRLLTVGLSFGVHTLTSFQNYNRYRGGNADFLGIDDGRRALPAGLPGTDSIQGNNTSRTNRAAIGRLFANDWALESGKANLPNLGLQLAGGRSWNVGNAGKNRFGLLGALNYSQNRRLVPRTRNDFDTQGQTERQQFDTWQTDILWGALLNLEYRIGERHALRLKNNFSVSSNDLTTVRTGSRLPNQPTEQLQRGTAYFFTSNTLLTSEVSGEHNLSSRNLQLGWSAFFTRQSNTIPSLRSLLYTRPVAAAGGDSDFVYSPSATGALNAGGIFYSRMVEYNAGGRADFTLPYKALGWSHKLKLGSYVVQKWRDFNARLLAFVPFNSTVNVVTQPSLFRLPQDRIFDPANFGNPGWIVDELTNDAYNYTSNSLLAAGYAMLDNTIGKRLRVVWGLRVEYFRQRLDGFDNSGQPVRVDNPYVDLLPSLNLTLRLRENMNLRAAVSRTVNRPEFRELAPFAFYDFTTNFVTLGNPNLRRNNVLNADLRYEWFPDAGDLIAVSVFYKNFDRPIEQIIRDGTGFGSTDITFRNIERGANNVGAEFEIRKHLGFGSWAYGRNFTFLFNFAYIYSALNISGLPNYYEAPGSRGLRPLQGQSPWLLNTGLQFNEPKTRIGATLLFNYIGRRISQVGYPGYPDIWENPRPVLDAQLSKKLGKYLELRLTASDLLAQALTFYQDVDNNGRFNGAKDRVINRLRFGQTITLNLTANF